MSPLVGDAAPHDMPSQISHHFSGGQDTHLDDAIGASNNMDESTNLRGDNDGVDGQPLANSAEEGRQSALLPPSPRQAVGVDMTPHSDETSNHDPSPFHRQH